MPFDRERMKAKAAELAAKGVFVGTSSWKFPNLDRFGLRAGKPNENFLNTDLFATAFLKPCEDIRDKVGVLMFEFSRFYPTDYEHGRDFVADLDSFLGKLPRDWPYAIEMRNRFWLKDEYFGCLARH